MMWESYVWVGGSHATQTTLVRQSLEGTEGNSVFKSLFLWGEVLPRIGREDGVKGHGSSPLK